MTKTENHVLDVIKNLTWEYGRCSFDIKLISETSGLMESTLYDEDAEEGILRNLHDDGFIIFDRNDRSVELDSETLC